VGVYVEPALECSGTVTLDITKFDEKTADD